MHERRLFKNMLIYVDACLSGGLFKDVLPDDIGVYAMTATDEKTDEMFWYWDGPGPYKYTAMGLIFEAKLFERELNVLTTKRLS